jgi:hypothetical protein
MITVNDLLTLADAFAAARGISDSRVSTLALNDGKALERIRTGGDIGARRLTKVWSWFADHWPEGAPWPSGVPQPPVPAKLTVCIGPSPVTANGEA